MVIAVARVSLHLPASRSLKDKRQILKSLLAQVQRQFQIAAAEVEHHDRLQHGVLGLACVSTDAAHADSVLARAIGFLASSKHETDLIGYETEILHVL
jgi:uncharacterized protein YlxP (DUF503 family)